MDRRGVGFPFGSRERQGAILLSNGREALRCCDPTPRHHRRAAAVRWWVHRASKPSITTDKQALENDSLAPTIFDFALRRRRAGQSLLRQQRGFADITRGEASSCVPDCVTTRGAPGFRRLTGGNGPFLQV